MLMDYEKAIIEKEIDRLDRMHRKAYERYEINGSRSCERTMKRCRILGDCLVRGLDVATYAEALETANSKMMRQLVSLECSLARLREEGKIQPGDAAELMRTIREG